MPLEYVRHVMHAVYMAIRLDEIADHISQAFSRLRSLRQCPREKRGGFSPPGQVQVFAGREQWIPALLERVDADQLPPEYGGLSTARMRVCMHARLFACMLGLVWLKLDVSRPRSGADFALEAQGCRARAGGLGRANLGCPTPTRVTG